MTNTPRVIPTKDQVVSARTWKELALILGIHARNDRLMKTIKEYVTETFPGCGPNLYGKRRTGRLSDEEFTDLVAISYTKRALIAACNYTPAGGSYTMVDDRIKRLGLDTSHFLGQAHLRGKTSQRKKDVAEYLVNGSTIKSCKLKFKLFRENLKDQKCEWCGITEWRGQPAPLELDHINGEKHDNRIENLRILCPNCHSQTPTFAGKNIGAGSGSRTP